MKKVLTFTVCFLSFFCIAVGAESLEVTVNNPYLDRTLNISGSFQKVTLSNGMPVCSMMSSAFNRNLGTYPVSTNRNGVFYLSIQQGAQEVCAGQYANYKIYKTDIDGIGISYNDADPASNSQGQAIPLWPQLMQKFTRSGDAMNISLNVDIRLWKYSTASNALPYGLVRITGPRVLQMVGPVAGDTLNRCSTQSGSAGGTTFCYILRESVATSSSVYASTCEFVNASKTVQMGQHYIPANAAEGYGSPWVDASFQLRCPNAWGYYSDLSSPSAATKNNAVTITVQPRDGVVNASKGIFKLDGSGAQGVGIQLAWGDYSSQANTPVNPVQLNTPTNANTLSSNFAAGPYAIGSNAVSGDGSIKMAARYIRTTGPVQPGPANGLVEILANYQ